jgi:acetyl-CoA carboxylase carboxyl transferase subunit beta
MSWLNRVRNSLPFTQKRDTPDNLWIKCPSCSEMLFTREYEENLSVCPRCEHHGRIGANARLAQLMDPGFELLPAPKVKEDPLKFRDTKKYTDRLKAAKAANPHPDALTNAVGTIEGHRAVVGVQEFAFMGGSMGMAVGNAFIAGIERAVRERAPYIAVTAAGGARMQEGILSLMQMPRTTVGISRLHAAGLPYIVVLTDPTTGGVTASYAMLGDVQIAEPGALIGFAGQRVIQDTIREKLPEGFQRAEYLHDHGMLDMVVHRRDLRSSLAQVIDYLTAARAA